MSKVLEGSKWKMVASAFEMSESGGSRGRGAGEIPRSGSSLGMTMLVASSIFRRDSTRPSSPPALSHRLRNSPEAEFPQRSEVHPAQARNSSG